MLFIQYGIEHLEQELSVADIRLTHLNLHSNCFVVYIRYTSILSQSALWIIIRSVTVSTFSNWNRDVKTVLRLNAFDKKKFVSTRCQKTNLGKSAKLVEKKRNEAGFNLTQGLRVVRWPLTRLLKRINQSWNYYPVALVQLYFILILILLKNNFICIRIS